MALKAFLNSPVSLKTTHFWGPVANWGFVLALLFPTADAALLSSVMLTRGDTVIPGIFVALALCVALSKRSKNLLFNCAFLRYTVGFTVAIITMNWFQAAQPALPYVAVMGLVAIHWWWNGEVKQVNLDGTNQLMGWNLFGNKLKKFDGWVLHTTNEDGNGGEDDAAALPEDHDGGPEDGYGGEEDAAATLEDLGYGGEKDAAASLEDLCHGSEEDAASTMEDHGYGGKEDADGGDQDDPGAASKDSNDDIVPRGRRAVQLLAIRANCYICTINGYDWQIGRCIYTRPETEVQEEGMVDLVPIGPRHVLMAYGLFTLEVFYCITTGNDGSSRLCSDPVRGCRDAPITVGWDVCGEAGEIEPEEYTKTIFCGGPSRKLEITFLVIPYAIETNFEVKLKLKDLGSRSRAVYGNIKVSTADYGNKSVHLFNCARGESWSVPGLTSILPLSPTEIALPYRRQLELQMEVDLIVITVFDNQEECKSLKFSLTFTRGIRSQEREVDDDQVEVSIAFDPEI